MRRIFGGLKSFQPSFKMAQEDGQIQALWKNYKIQIYLSVLSIIMEKMYKKLSLGGHGTWICKYFDIEIDWSTFIWILKDDVILTCLMVEQCTVSTYLAFYRTSSVILKCWTFKATESRCNERLSCGLYVLYSKIKFVLKCSFWQYSSRLFIQWFKTIIQRKIEASYLV